MTAAATLVMQACSSLAAARPEEARVHVLAAWRVVRSPVLAELLDAIDQMCHHEPLDLAVARGRAPADISDDDDDESGCVAELFEALRGAAPADAAPDAWLARAQKCQPGDLRGLLDALARPEELARQRWAALERRIEALAAWPDDPRVAVALAELHERLPHGSPRSRELQRRTAAMINRIGDRRVVTRRELTDPARARGFAAAIPAAPILGAELRAACERLGELCGARVGPLEEDFLARIYAEPSDERARLEYADWLAERGDPWAELIRADLRAGELAPVRREALVREHGWRFLGVLAGAVSDPRFYAGFPVAGSLRSHNGRAALQAAAGRREWSTFDELELDGFSPCWQSPMRPRLVTNVTPDDLMALLASQHARARVEQLSATFLPTEEGAAARAFDALVHAEGMPRLRALSVGRGRGRLDPARLRPLWSSPAGAALTSLRCVAEAASIARWLDELARAPATLAEVVIEAVEPAGWQLDASRWVFTLTRDPGGRFSEVLVRGAGDPDIDPLRAALQDVAPRVTRLSLQHAGRRFLAEDVKRLSEALPRSGLRSALQEAIRAQLAAWVRPEVERFPSVTVRRRDLGAEWTFQQETMTIGELVLTWAGCVLGWSCRGRALQPVRSGEEVQVGELRFEIEIEDVARIVPDDGSDLVCIDELAQRYGDADVAVQMHESALRVGEVVWHESRVPRGRIDRLAAALLAAARLVETAARSPRADAAWLTAQLEKDRGSLRGSMQAPDFLIEDGALVIGSEVDTWVTSHRLGKRFERKGSLALAAIPRDEKLVKRLLGLLMEARFSAVIVPKPYGCRFCGQIFHKLHMHDRVTCHSCAESHLGVIH